MDATRAVADAVEVLRERLAAAVARVESGSEATFGHPSQVRGERATLNLFIAQLRESPHREPAARGVGRLVEADLLLSAHAPRTAAAAEPVMLEAALRVLSDSPVLVSESEDSRADIVTRPAPLEELAGVWRALGVPLRPSVLCVLRARVAPAGRAHELRAL